MRAQFIELTAPRWCLALNSLSAKSALTMSYEGVKGRLWWFTFHTDLTIIESTLDGDVVDVGVGHSGHLCLLDR